MIENYLTQAYNLGIRGDIVVALEYERFDLWQKRGAGYFVKRVPRDILIAETDVNGNPAYWIESDGHTIRFVDEDGTEIAGSERTVIGNVLVWNSAETFYRIEGDLSQEEALAIAESLP